MEAVTSFAWNFPWAFSTLVTGPLFDLELYLIPFWFTLTSYSAATVFYATFFWKIEEHQGTIIVPKKAIPGVGWTAIFRDLEGNTFGLMEEDPTAK